MTLSADIMYKSNWQQGGLKGALFFSFGASPSHTSIPQRNAAISGFARSRASWRTRTRLAPEATLALPPALRSTLWCPGKRSGGRRNTDMALHLLRQCRRHHRGCLRAGGTSLATRQWVSWLTSRHSCSRINRGKAGKDDVFDEGAEVCSFSDNPSFCLT